MEIFERRLQKFKSVISKRQDDLVVILENIWDPHNIGAILRSCDSVGVHKVYLINTDPKLQNEKLYQKLSSASGASKWLQIKFFTEVEKAVDELHQLTYKIYTTHLSASAVSIYNIDFTQKVAIAFGNEHDGISEQLLNLSDGNMIIPQYGMVQSLNISVACAVCLFEISRQRQSKGMYDQDFQENNQIHVELFEKYKLIHSEKKLRKISKVPKKRI